MTTKLDTRPWNLGLPLVLLAACGRTLPLLPSEDSDSDTDDPMTMTDPTEPPETTVDPDECKTSEDCPPGFYCSETNQCIEYYDYCSDGGCCYDACCYDGCHYYECYSDAECGEGFVCNYYTCEPGPPGPELCREIPIGFDSAQVMHDYEGGISLAFVDAPGPGHELATADANGLRVLGVDGEVFAAEIGAVSMAVGDVDGDEDEDIVVLTESALHTFLLDPVEGFAAGPVTELGALGFVRLTLADFDGNGTKDAFATTPNAMLQFASAGDGNFIAGSEVASTICGVTAVRGDTFPGFDDLLFGETGQAWIAPGNADGVIQPYSIGGGYSFDCSIAVGDFDGDGVADAAMLDPSNVGGVTTWWSVASAAPSSSWNPPFYHAVAGVADLDGDGLDDLVLAGNSTDATFRFGTDAFELSCYAMLPLGFSPIVLAIGDFDGDGGNDIVGADGQSVWIAPSPL